jgi:hypothetical protein
MSAFGGFKFGGATFGADALSIPRMAVEVDWDADGGFDGSNEATQGLIGISIERGRKYVVSSNGDGLEEESTGRFTANFLDFARRYDFYNSSTPLYGQLAGGKLFRVRLRSIAGNTYDLMAGLLNTPISSVEADKTPTARFDGSDGWGLLRDQRNLVTIPLQQNIYVDDAIGLLLDDAGWPLAWGRSLDPGVEQLSYWWTDAGSAAKEAHYIAYGELGTVMMAGDGSFVFHNRQRVDGPVLTLTSTDVLDNGVRRMSPDEVVRNLIKVRSSVPQKYPTSTLWTLGDPVYLQASESAELWAEYEYNASAVPATAVITPVITTDYKMFANSDGTGTDLTADLSVSMLAYSTQAVLTVTNNGASAGYITLLQVRGDPIVSSNTTAIQKTDADSVRIYGSRPFEMVVPHTVNTARQYAELLLATLAPARDYLVVELVPNPDIQFAADLGDQVAVSLPDLSIENTFVIFSIEHRSMDNLVGMFQTTWMLEPVSRVSAGVQVPFQVPFQVGTV